MRELARTVKVSPLEKISGARGDRAELAKALKRLEGGDTLIVTRLDRLARSTRDLLNILHSLSQNDVSFKSLHDVWADTTSAHGRLMLTILGGLAEFERELSLAQMTAESALRPVGCVLGGRTSSPRTNDRKHSHGSLMVRRKLTSPGAMPSIRQRSADWLNAVPKWCHRLPAMVVRPLLLLTHWRAR